MDYILNPFDYVTVPFGRWVEAVLALLVGSTRATLLAMKAPVQGLLAAFQTLLLSIPPLVGLLLAAGAGYALGRGRLALTGLGCLVAIGAIGAWSDAMITLSIVLSAVLICVTVGIPVGILAARSDRFWALLRPFLDFLQTIPSFVYLVPVVMLFGIGDASGVIVTCIYAIGPLVRLTNLGLREVRADLVEAAHAYGASDWRTLRRIQLPLARPTIMAGVNQTVMLSLSMTVVASMISVAGLGRMVLEGIGRLDFGSAAVGGVAVVLTAILVDRFTQAMAARKRGRG